MTDHSSRQFTKQVAIKATDDAEQIATGLALTADEVDHQLDFFRAEGVEAMYNPDPDHGVMHGRFPDDDAELVRNEVLDEDETIDGAEFEAGDWVVQRKYHNDELWDFVERGVLNGYSIGGEVTEGIEYDSIEDLPDDVEIPDVVDPDAVDEKYWPPVQVTNGFVSEISDVDIPAVVSAQFSATKADKSIVDEVAGEDEFVAVMAGDEDSPGRGHSEKDARELWSYLESIGAADAKHAMSKSQTDPDVGGLDDEDVGFLKRLRQAFSKTDADADPDSDDDVSPEPGQSEVSGITLAKALEATKEGRPLNADNREALMAAHDAIEASLASDKDFETNRFTDDPDSAFDLTEYADKFGGGDGEDEDEDDEDEKAAPVEKLTEEQGDLVVNALQRFVDNQGEAPFADFSSWIWKTDVLDDDTAFAADEAVWQYREYVREQRDETPVTEDFADWVESESDADADLTMSKDKNTDGGDDPFADAPEWAKALKEQQEKNSERIEEELSEKDAGGEDDGDEDAFKEAPEWAKALKAEQEKNAEQIDAISKQTGASQQLGGVEKDDEDADMADESAQFKKALGGGVGGGDF